MSYIRTCSAFFQENYEFNDDELIGWYCKLEKELAEFYEELDSSLRPKICGATKQKKYLVLLTTLKESFDNLEKLIAPKTELVLDKNTNELIKMKLNDFNCALEPMWNFIKKEMYSRKLEYILLKLKSILLSIANFFLGRDLQYSRTTVAGSQDCIFIYQSAGPATHSTPRYILPERPRISLFFSQQLFQALEEKTTAISPSQAI